MSLEEVFCELVELDKKGIESIVINEHGLCTYLFNMPVLDQTIEPSTCYVGKDYVLYNIPRIGDLVLKVTIKGKFKETKLYAYDWTGSREIIYDLIESFGDICEIVMNPFPTSGYPLLPCGKALYLNVVEPCSDSGSRINVDVIVTYAFLDTKSRQKLIYFRDGNTNHGVKVRHANGDIYQAININEHGYSPNYLVKCLKLLGCV